jgi:hypothetical protein
MIITFVVDLTITVTYSTISLNQRGLNSAKVQGATIMIITFIVDLTVSVDVCLPDHLVHLLVGQLLAQVGHHVTQLGRRDETVAVLQKHKELI